MHQDYNNKQTRNMKRLILPMLCLLMMAVGCKNKNQPAAENTDSTNAATETVVTTQADDGKHNEAYIRKRLQTIYELQDDKTCCSEAYLQLDAEARKISQRTGTIYIDGDHWVAGQDIDEEWSYRIDEISDITDHTAKAKLTVHNFSDQDVVLYLCFERDDWYVNDFHFFYENDEGRHELSELEEMKRYINEGTEP